MILRFRASYLNPCTPNPREESNTALDILFSGIYTLSRDELRHLRMKAFPSRKMPVAHFLTQVYACQVNYS